MTVDLEKKQYRCPECESEIAWETEDNENNSN